MLIPYEIDLASDRRPWANYLILALILVGTVMQFNYVLHDVEIRNASVAWLFFHMWAHGGLIQFISNVWFLWILGNPVCSKLGNIKYFSAYIFLGLFSGAGHLLFSNREIIGATGTIYGVFGMYLVFFPSNSVNWVVIFLKAATLMSSSFWLLVYWIPISLLGAGFAMEYVPVANYCIGLLAGMTLAFILLAARSVRMNDDECSLLQLIGVHPRNEIKFDREGKRITGQVVVSNVKPSKDIKLHMLQSSDDPTRTLKLDLPQKDQQLQSDEAIIHESSRLKLEPVPPVSNPNPPKPRRVSSKATQFDSNVFEIIVTCSCGHKFPVKSGLKDKTQKCPACSKPVQPQKEMKLKFEE